MKTVQPPMYVRLPDYDRETALRLAGEALEDDRAVDDSPWWANAVARKRGNLLKIFVQLRAAVARIDALSASCVVLEMERDGALARCDDLKEELADRDNDFSIIVDRLSGFASDLDGFRRPR